MVSVLGAERGHALRGASGPESTSARRSATTYLPIRAAPISATLIPRYGDVQRAGE